MCIENHVLFSYFAASEVTGISYEMLKQKEPFKVVFTHFLMWIDTTVAEVFKTTGVAHIPGTFIFIILQFFVL